MRNRLLIGLVLAVFTFSFAGCKDKNGNAATDVQVLGADVGEYTTTVHTTAGDIVVQNDIIKKYLTTADPAVVSAIGAPTNQIGADAALLAGTSAQKQVDYKAKFSKAASDIAVEQAARKAAEDKLASADHTRLVGFIVWFAVSGAVALALGALLAFWLGKTTAGFFVMVVGLLLIGISLLLGFFDAHAEILEWIGLSVFAGLFLYLVIKHIGWAAFENDVEAFIVKSESIGGTIHKWVEAEYDKLVAWLRGVKATVATSPAIVTPPPPPPSSVALAAANAAAAAKVAAAPVSVAAIPTTK